ncbi:MAG: glucosamine-6-phosphate deaminase [Chlorobi bacterium]|nr:glucosamine-6-phosphate deaminase [Chlorobiota bacterium]
MNPIAYRKPGQFEETKYEKIHNVVFDSDADASVVVAREIADLIRRKQEEGKPAVLGLATGSSPIKVYDELVRMHREEGLSFKNVITFNLDEYYPMEPDNPNSYHYFMDQYLFNHIDIPRENIHIPDGTVPPEKITEYCMEYEKKIEEAGGIDFQLLGIGRSGHIGFNEPGSHINSRTRLITLAHITRVDAAPAFHGLENVPRKAITMGISTILKARRIVLLAWSKKKAPIIKRTVEGEISSDVPATYLQTHPNTTFVLDREAASKLTRIDTPWIVKDVEWTPHMTKKAVVWLSEKTGLPILKLTDKEYNQNYLSDLIATKGSAYDLNIDVFNRIQHTITGWPGGKPHADDTYRPERAEPARKRVIVFSPHPDDDVISMGGTLDRLIQQGHDVHVAYQVAGYSAVSDEEALKFLEVQMLTGHSSPLTDRLVQELQQKNRPQDSDELKKLKASIRRAEAIAALRYLGVPLNNIHFLDLPFYDAPEIHKRKISPLDVEIMFNIIDLIKPHQIFAAADFADPHGTHQLSFITLQKALERVKEKPYAKDLRVWLYRGAWDEFEIPEIDMTVPMSPDQVLRKRHAIFYHQSQKDIVLFRGDDMREFWMRAEERNKELARKFDKLGLAEYEAMEAFKRYYF